MARLTFSYDPQKGSVSSEFAGSVALQCIFSGTGKHVIFVESRIGDEMPWAVLRTVVVKARDVFSIPEASKGQVYRIFTDSEPESVETSPISGGGGGSSYDIPDEENNDGEVNTMQEILKAFKNFPEGTTIQ